MNIEKNYKEKILNIWNEYSSLKELNEPNCDYRKFPIAPIKVKQNSILFIGVNPSFGKYNKTEQIKNKIEFYPQIENQKDIPYFEKFKDISNYVDVDWTHLDLLFIRETNQKVISKMMKTKKGIEFISRQLDLSFDIMEKSKPRIIVVANSLASEFFGKMKKKHLNAFKSIWKGHKLDFNNDFDKQIGTYKISLNNKEIPIIFSGMLSGQRALDIGSLERLKWQIKMIINSNKW